MKLNFLPTLALLPSILISAPTSKLADPSVKQLAAVSNSASSETQLFKGHAVKKTLFKLAFRNGKIGTKGDELIPNSIHTEIGGERLWVDDASLDSSVDSISVYDMEGSLRRRISYGALVASVRHHGAKMKASEFSYLGSLVAISDGSAFTVIGWGDPKSYRNMNHALIHLDADGGMLWGKQLPRQIADRFAHAEAPLALEVSGGKVFLGELAIADMAGLVEPNSAPKPESLWNIRHSEKREGRLSLDTVELDTDQGGQSVVLETPERSETGRWPVRQEVVAQVGRTCLIKEVTHEKYSGYLTNLVLFDATGKSIERLELYTESGLRFFPEGSRLRYTQVRQTGPDLRDDSSQGAPSEGDVLEVVELRLLGDQTGNGIGLAFISYPDFNVQAEILRFGAKPLPGTTLERMNWISGDGSNFGQGPDLSVTAASLEGKSLVLEIIGNSMLRRYRVLEADR